MILRLAICLFLAFLHVRAATAAGIEMIEVGAAGFPASLYETGQGPLVIVVAGSGPTDRKGNSPPGVTASYLEKLSAALAAKGYSSLRDDKRGVQGSAPVESESNLTLDTFVDDLNAVTGWARKRWPGRKIVLAGHSEGGLVAMLAAVRNPPAALILLASLGQPAADTLRPQLVGLPKPLSIRAFEIAATIEGGGRTDDVPMELSALFRPSVQPFLASLFAARPAEIVSRLDTPLLVVGGGNDLQVRRADFDALSQARLDAAKLWLPAMNHVLTDTEADAATNLQTYARADLPLSKGLADGVVEFLRGLSQD